MDETLLTLDSITKIVKKQTVIDELSLRISGGISGIFGRNGSGKSLLAEIIAGRIRPDGGMITARSGGCRTSVVSSSEKLRLLEEERRNDDSEFMGGKTDPGRSVVRFIFGEDETEEQDWKDVVDELELEPILGRGLKFLSTGEFRKVLILRALREKPDLLILDDPFTGLDIGMRAELKELINRTSRNIDAVLLVSGRLGDFKELTDDIKTLEDGRIKNVEKIKASAPPAVPPVASAGDAAGAGVANETARDGLELIKMRGVSLSYYDLKVLNDINWTVTSGQHWQLRGRNGSGKSSIISLINGDNPKAYGQKIDLFGRRRGTGETVWDIKKRIGTVSGALQLSHRISQNVLSVAVSGFYDSIGLYDKPDPIQIETAEAWCEQFGLKDRLREPFESLSEGLKRKVLTVRAVIKRPDLLILDEPCQGLDDYNSGVVLDTVEFLIEKNHSTLIYVSHDPEYNMKSITNIMDLIPHEGGGYTNI